MEMCTEVQFLGDAEHMSYDQVRRLRAGESFATEALLNSEWGIISTPADKQESSSVAAILKSAGWQSVAARYNSSVRINQRMTVVEQVSAVRADRSPKISIGASQSYTWLTLFWQQILQVPKPAFGVVFFNSLRHQANQ